VPACKLNARVGGAAQLYGFPANDLKRTSRPRAAAQLQGFPAIDLKRTSRPCAALWPELAVFPSAYASHPLAHGSSLQGGGAPAAAAPAAGGAAPEAKKAEAKKEEPSEEDEVRGGRTRVGECRRSEREPLPATHAPIAGSAPACRRQRLAGGGDPQSWTGRGQVQLHAEHAHNAALRLFAPLANPVVVFDQPQPPSSTPRLTLDFRRTAQHSQDMGFSLFD
jgi:hypothetical protein